MFTNNSNLGRLDYEIWLRWLDGPLDIVMRKRRFLVILTSHKVKTIRDRREVEREDHLRATSRCVYRNFPSEAHSLAIASKLQLTTEHLESLHELVEKSKVLYRDAVPVDVRKHGVELWVLRDIVHLCVPHCCIRIRSIKLLRLVLNVLLQKRYGCSSGKRR